MENLCYHKLLYSIFAIFQRLFQIKYLIKYSTIIRRFIRSNEKRKIQFIKPKLDDNKNILKSNISS